MSASSAAYAGQGDRTSDEGGFWGWLFGGHHQSHSSGGSDMC
ncbi:hypothetical protein [Larsenimonas rhizosphaerae]|uniref:Uncharacterized protein n=1 Tax=Larsenimonas rhizosphaerae TaxID=2944682 RepID=A0AA41ZG83_9GAMM|nr:hypothetical protein [Larsenimonas rhizosphaerae]MCX2524056.1 hypothetical protein [Larsenimonas rhizosphaerae]